MITTGLKQVVVNNPDQVVYDDTAKVLNITGVGKFDTAKVHKCSFLAPQAATPGQYEMDFTSALLNYSVGDLLSIGLKFSTYRNQGEFASHYKEGADPLVLQKIATTAVSTTQLAVDVAAAITAMTVEQKERYKIASASASAGVVTVVMSEWSVILKKFEVNGESGILIQNGNATIAVEGKEGRGLPQFMEESIKTDGFETRGTYALQNDMQLDMNSNYIQLNIFYSYQTTAMTNTSVLNGGPTQRVAQAQIWLKENAFTDAVLTSLKVIDSADADNSGFYFGDVVDAQNVPTSGTEDAYALLEVGTFQDVV